MSVTKIEDELVRLQEATDRLDKDEDALKRSREHLSGQVRSAWLSGAAIAQIQEVTGFSRGHVYDLLGELTRPHSEVRRERRKRITAEREGA
jgi:hypothetical protein